MSQGYKNDPKSTPNVVLFRNSLSNSHQIFLSSIVRSQAMFCTLLRNMFFYHAKMLLVTPNEQNQQSQANADIIICDSIL